VIRVTLRGARACLSYRLGFLSILWWEKGGWRGMGIRKVTAKGGWGKVLDIITKVIGAGQPTIHVVFFLALLLEVAMFALFQSFSILQQE
jgi:hypothetical protein